MIECLEFRQVLNATSKIAFVAYPMFELGSLVSNTMPPSSAFTPSQIQQAYGVNQIRFGSVTGDGTGQTIAIVDAYDTPTIQADLNTFDAQFGLPNITVTRVNQNGGTSYPAVDSTGGWQLETALDVEWAHAIAPGAQILLVEANSANDGDLLPAVNYAAAHASVVSMSWGGGEFSGENTYDSNFAQSGVAFVASSGDSGAPASWPAVSPNVVAVGGTALSLGANAAYASESGWSGSGGGPSAYESQPSYQSGVVTQTRNRATPDVAYDASPSTGFAVYNSSLYNGTAYGWIQIGGTSAGAPQWAALVAIADQGRALSGRPAINSTNPQEVLTTLYQNVNTTAFHDVTSGTSTGNPHYSAGPGYDLVTGLGSPVSNLLVPSLVGTPSSSSLFSDNFSGATLGPAWSTVNGAWSESGGLLHQTSLANGDPKKAQVTGVAFPTDVEVTARVRVDSWAGGDSARVGVSLGDDAAGNGYNLVFHNDTNTVAFLNDKIAWGNTYAFAWQVGTWYDFKLREQGGVLYGKIWVDGQAEPSGWMFQQAGWASRSGAPGVNGGSDAGATASFGNVAVNSVS